MLFRENGKSAAALLVPSTPRLERRADGRLWLVRGSHEVAVQAVRCFPWSAPVEHISLRDEDDEEAGYVTRVDELDPDSRSALEGALADAGFLIAITAIDEIDEDQEIRCWVVQTQRGPRRFQTRLETWPRPVPGGGLLIEDVAGDLFWIRDPAALDDKSREALWAYVD